MENHTANLLHDKRRFQITDKDCQYQFKICKLKRTTYFGVKYTANMIQSTKKGIKLIK